MLQSFYIVCSGISEWGDPQCTSFHTEPRCSDNIQSHSGKHWYQYYFSDLGYSPTRPSHDFIMERGYAHR